MKTAKVLIPIIVATLICTSCHKEKHFITDKEYRTQVHEDFLKRQELASGRADALFAGMDTLDSETREALEFLYAYMPYSDLADYDLSFYLKQVRAAFAAREKFEWGKKIPEDIFRHFVLVYRVNNENLDTARLLMQKELAPRLEGLSMYDAALEVNHWCHEYVAYRASDGRTSAPLATMRTSLGRCGEESTFTVTALRSVGIPARQCYTPRWAHCDDNHAWVEVYIADSNKWYFLGACEPDPELDMGWFAVPSTRCMMVHSNAFGRYKGNEEINFQNSMYAKINMLGNYAPTKKITVTVYDVNEKPAKNVDVKFKLYNYSEFYPLATVKTDDKGKASLTTGAGDLLIWATDGKNYNYVKMDVRNQESIDIYMTRENGNEYTEMLDIVPPLAGEAKVIPDKKKTAVNEQRKAQEDSIRDAYTATFPTQDNYKQLLNNNTLLTDAQAWEIIKKSEGNYNEIAKFINKVNERNSDIFTVKNQLYDYLCSFSDKDMRDMTAETLEAHCVKQENHPYEIFKKGIMPARISNEMVRPWRKFLNKELSTIDNATALKSWILQNISVDDSGNYYNCPISPRGVYELRHSDPHSRDIFFVAACRSLNIPAYLDNATNTIYVWEQGNWNAITFEKEERSQPSAELTLTFKPSKELSVPIYWTHFTLAKYENGDFVTFDFENDDRMSKFPATIHLEPGYYCLTTGNRYPEGDVLVRVEYFNVSEGQKLSKEIIPRPLTERTKETDYASIDPNQEIIAEMATLSDYAGSTGMLFVFLGDYKEPSKHLIKEMQSLKKEYAQWGGMTYLVAPANAKATSWKLPNTDCIVCEPGQADPFEKQITTALKLDLHNDYPLVAIIDNKGRILFHSHGYSIGLAEQILKKARTLN